MQNDFCRWKTPDAAVQRIIKMEQCYDRLLQLVQQPSDTPDGQNRLCSLYHTLVEYYENGLWLQDYTLDEQGLLPPGLKRGVLSQDSLYGLLQRIEQPGKSEPLDELPGRCDIL